MEVHIILLDEIGWIMVFHIRNLRSTTDGIYGSRDLQDAICTLQWKDLKDDYVGSAVVAVCSFNRRLASRKWIGRKKGRVENRLRFLSFELIAIGERLSDLTWSSRVCTVSTTG